MAQKESEYSAAQIKSMQNDAIKRVNEMQRIAKEKIKSSPNFNKTEHSHKSQESCQQINDKQNINEKVREHENHNNNQNHNHQLALPIQNDLFGLGNSFKGIIDRLNLDDEKIILIVMLVLLVNEGADSMLILALVYILL